MKRRGLGRIFKRGTTCWFAYYGPDAKRPGRKREYRESAECSCGAPAGECRTAERKLRQRLGELHGDRFVGPSQERISIATLLDEYEAHRQLAGRWKSQDRARSQVGRVKGFFGASRATEVTIAGLKTWVTARLEEGYARATVRQWLATLRAAMRLALKEGRLTRVPYFPTVTVQNVRRGFFERDEFEAVVRHVKTPWSDVARFGYLTGWRAGEIRGLRWENVDRRAGVIQLHESKSGEPRTVPLVGELAELIERRWAARAVGTTLVPVVFHVRGRAIGNFRKRWIRACRLVGVPNALFHDLRRTAVRDMVRAGVAETVAMSISGHKTRHVFDRYNITSADDQREALRRLDAYREARPAKVTDISRTKGAAGA